MINKINSRAKVKKIEDTISDREAELELENGVIIKASYTRGAFARMNLRMVGELVNVEMEVFYKRNGDIGYEIIRTHKIS